MKRFHWVRLYLLLLVIVLFAAAVISCVYGCFAVYRETAIRHGLARSRQGIYVAGEALEERLLQIAKTAGYGQYDVVMDLAHADDEGLSERELEELFRTGYEEDVRAEIEKDGSICDGFNTFLENAGLYNVTVAPNARTIMEAETGGDSLIIRNVTIADAATGSYSETFDFRIMIPDAVFHAGSDELFDYCMVSGKGIYITGMTSSVIGDIFAGQHSPEECREAEIVYGETGTYGGLNILSTQLGIRADTIVSMGDINLNGSFVVFAANNEKLDCYTQRLNEIEGFSKKTSYTMEGSLNTVHAAGNNPAAYSEAVKLMDISLSRLNEIPIYYDSDNDGGYEGRYRKLISDTDVEIRTDYTGIVATPANVIIDNDVNFEGLILCGDRIYAMGNNNIVANAAVARDVIASESGDKYGIRISDYIGGMKIPGLTEPERYIVTTSNDQGDML